MSLYDILLDPVSWNPLLYSPSDNILLQPAITAIVSPVISGVPAANQELTCSTGTWSASPTSYSYQWISNGVNVGANSLNYTPQPSDVWNTVQCIVTAYSGSFIIGSAPSNGVIIGGLPIGGGNWKNSGHDNPHAHSGHMSIDNPKRLHVMDDERAINLILEKIGDKRYG